jgi:hypothetical protein
MASEVQFEFNSADVRPFLAMPVFGSVPPPTVRSLIETVLMLKSKGVKFEVSLNCGTSVIEVARNILLDQFLRSSCDRIFWLDADLEWSAADFFTVLGLSSLYDVVGATYRYKDEEVKFSLRLEHAGCVDVNKHGLIKVLGSGIGFTCITRKVMEIMAGEAPRFKLNRTDEKDLARVFRVSIGEDGAIYGEDMDFFKRLADAGFDCLLYPHAKIGHIGSKTYTGILADAIRGDEYESSEEAVKVVDLCAGARETR